MRAGTSVLIIIVAVLLVIGGIATFADRALTGKWPWRQIGFGTHQVQKAPTKTLGYFSGSPNKATGKTSSTTQTATKCSPEDMLAKTRAARLENVKTRMDNAVAHHKLTKEQAANIVAIVKAHPDGWNKDKNTSKYQIDGDQVTVTWDAIGNGLKGDLSSVGHCTCYVETHFTFEPVTRIIERTVVITHIRGDCYQATFPVRPGDEILLRIDSPVGRLRPETGCDYFRQGDGPPLLYRDDFCNWCRPDLYYSEDALGREVPQSGRFGYAIIAQANTMTFSFDASVLGMLPSICNHTLDTKWVFITPPGKHTLQRIDEVTWGHRHHIIIPGSKFVPDDDSQNGRPL
ncbi:MAG TPA: hypothetical protein VHB93_01845 [Candidatus Paceibacterota bacterium]|nr:hypothetical protein [Candidatus Paceibacterota bacterium]